MKPDDDVLAFYASHGPLSGPRQYADLFSDLPAEVDALCRLVQGLMVHIFWAKRYGLELSQERQQEASLRSVAAKLQRILELDERPLHQPRPPEKKLVGNCRDFSLMLTAMLRHQGIPARARCGFGAYFRPNRYEDHWVVEYWEAADERWVMVDPQLDALQRKVLAIRFDPLDMSPGWFVSGGQAWLTCRAGEADPDRFGIFNMHGMGFIRGDLVRDLLSLNKVEILPWDVWGLVALEDEQLTPADLDWLDQAARLTQGGNACFVTLQAHAAAEARLQIPAEWLQ